MRKMGLFVEKSIVSMSCSLRDAWLRCYHPRGDMQTGFPYRFNMNRSHCKSPQTRAGHFSPLRTRSL